MSIGCDGCWFITPYGVYFSTIGFRFPKVC